MESREIADREKDPGLTSFCNLLGKQFVRAKSMQPANLTPDKMFVSHEPLVNNPAELIVVDTKDKIGSFRRLQIFKLFPAEQPFQIQIQDPTSDVDDEFIVPNFVVLRAAPENDLAVLCGINPSHFIHADTIIHGQDSGSQAKDDFVPSTIIELGREVLNGDLVPMSEID